MNPNLSISQSGQGGQPGAFLRMGVGAKAIGMGRTFTGFANDASATFWNPAGLGTLKLTELHGTYSLLSMERQHNYAAAVFPFKSLGTIGFSWIHVGVDDIQGRDEIGRLTNTFSNSEDAYMFSWGFPLFRFFYLGCSFKYLTHQLESNKSSGYGFDAGALLKITDFLSIGTTFQDIATNVKWDTQTRFEEEYPIVNRIGFSLRPFEFPITVGADYVMVKNKRASIHAGLESTIFSGLGVRLGYDNGHLAAGGFISIPMRQMHFQTDYSFGEDPIDETYVHRVSFQLKFAPTDYYFHKPREITSELLEDELSSMYPPPDAKVIRIMQKNRNYALINIGSDSGVKEGVIFEVFRPVSVGENSKSKKLLIGNMKVVRVKANVSAIQVVSMKEGFLLESGDVLYIEGKNE